MPAATPTTTSCTPWPRRFSAPGSTTPWSSRREAFPNLRTIVLAGHSAGGQFVSRYQMANQVHEKLNVPIAYIVANPSSYGYLDTMRSSSSTFATNVSALAPGYVPAPPAKPLPAFVAYDDAGSCTGYDAWPYGLQKRVGYAARQSDEQLQKQLASRPMTYRFGHTRGHTEHARN